MKCLLMNKNTKFALVEFDTSHNEISEIYEIINIDYASLGVYNTYFSKSLNLTTELNNWFKSRGIPSWRKDLEGLLKRLQISSPEELLNKSYALSLSDQYWIKEENSDIKWKDINFFTNDFEYEAYLTASLDSSSDKPSNASLKSPNNTTDGMLQKGWSIEDGKRVLVKGTYTANHEEPFNEWLASQISKKLNYEYCNYEVALYKDGLVSKCENFLNENEEIISAYDIFNSKKKPNNINDYEHYISILEEHNVPNARQSVANMFIVDYLMLNTDRHLKNFGVIRNVETLDWIKATPIFDTGQSMNCDKPSMNMIFSKGKGKFFTNTSKDFENILKIIGCDYLPKNIDKLKDITKEYEKLLKEYQPKFDISEQRIDKLVNGLNTRISMLEKYIEKCQLIDKDEIESDITGD